ncbi:MAG: MBL fold metallo-hydrolase [Eubacteriales bacterium]|nr:MBL fold metallo-hydrolase [Eubacteriales bacterium]
MPLGEALLEEIRNARPPQDCAALWWLGQMGYAVKIGGTAILIDGFLCPREDRLIPPAFDPEQADCFDAVLGTHDHDDHIDCWAWRRIARASDRTRFVGPAAHRERVCRETGIDPSRYVAMNEGARVQIGEISIEAVAAAHEFLDRDPATGWYPHLSYVLAGKIFHGGDTLIYEGQREKLRRFGRFAAMILPINGRDGARYRRNCIGNMTFQEAADLAGELRPMAAIPGHYDMFSGNLGDPEAFADYLDAKYPGMQSIIPRRFERFDCALDA